nr:hypothetical protein CFP56_75546 [Quercus suber]
MLGSLASAVLGRMGLARRPSEQFFGIESSLQHSSVTISPHGIPSCSYVACRTSKDYRMRSLPSVPCDPIGNFVELCLIKTRVLGLLAAIETFGPSYNSTFRSVI